MVEQNDRGGGGGADVARAAARRLRELALDYADRSLASQAELVRAFEAEAGPLARDVGEVMVDDDDDERLVLTPQGRFAGEVLDDDTAEWQSVASAEDVADHYDPVDLFTDLADAIADAFPEVVDATTDGDSADEMAGREPNPPFVAATMAGASDTELSQDAGGHEPSPPVEGSSPESVQLRVLEDLRNAGVLTAAQFEHAKANLRD